VAATHTGRAWDHPGAGDRLRARNRKLGARDDSTQALSLSVGNRTVTVAGHYKDMTQESVSNGMKVIVDGHEIQITDDQLTVDDKTQVLEPDQDVMIYVAQDGKVQVKIVQESEGAPEEAPE
jgi:hypothetical protein